jgi:hypothetical protein
MILSMVLLLLLISIPLVAYAQSVTINGFPVSNPFTGSVGGFEIDSLQGVPVPGVPNILSLTALQITNIGTSRATLTIVYQHNFFFDPSFSSSQRFHGASMDGTFFDPANLLRVVSGSTITKTSLVGYRCIGCTLVFTAYDTPKTYTVPTPPPAVSVYDNGFGPPNPPQASGTLVCSVVVGGPCDGLEVLYTVVEITLDPGISLGLVG